MPECLNIDGAYAEKLAQAMANPVTAVSVFMEVLQAVRHSRQRSLTVDTVGVGMARLVGPAGLCVFVTQLANKAWLTGA